MLVNAWRMLALAGTLLLYVGASGISKRGVGGSFNLKHVQYFYNVIMLQNNHTSKLISVFQIIK